MDECTLWEINDIINNLQFLDRNLWESQRLSSYITATSVHPRKKLTQQDICKFPWEKKDIEEFIRDEDDTSISNDDVKRLQNLSNQQWVEVE